MHPMRCVGQALDALQARHVVVLRLGQILTEVAVALPPDDQRWGGDRTQLRVRVLLAYRGPIVVDHPGCRPRLRPRLERFFDTLPIGRVVGPADIAALAVHLMTNTAVTGATFDIDGGQQLVEG